MEITMIVKKLLEKGGEIFDIYANCIEIKIFCDVKIYVDDKNEILDIRQDQIQLQYPFTLLTEKTLNKILAFVEE